MSSCPFTDDNVCLQSSCRLWDSENSNCSLALINQTLNKLLSLMTHIHTKHEHVTPHHIDGDSLLSDGGPHNLPISGPTSILIQELLSGMDLDGNGMVFGRDFTIQPLPSMLESLSSLISPFARIYTLQAYLNSINWPSN